ncbi:MAG TPA: hypothetical protein QF468_08775 [Nitrospinota bacterium]|jgi:multidrug efflux pump subunit AcrB|nr:hypothetical protein [Nitrospinota bacterium]|tara:strand:+ start:3421 stop:3927 length:507 start_codon:yes stop_codon:yes gene_type:complete
MSLYEKLQSHLLNETKESVSKTYNTGEVFKGGLEKTVKQINSGFQWTMYMYLLVFIIGVVFLGISVYMAITTEKEFVPTIFGGMGMLGVLSFFFSKTPIELQRSRAELAQLQAALFNWYIDITNWNSYLLKNQDISLEEFKEVSQEQMIRTDQTVKLISTYVQNKPNK